MEYSLGRFSDYVEYHLFSKPYKFGYVNLCFWYGHLSFVTQAQELAIHGKTGLQKH